MKTILVVEDEIDAADALRLLLSLYDYRVIVASNGREGLEQAIANQPDLILTDLMMPVMNGDDLIRNLRANPTTRSIPVITMSAAWEDGRDVLRKPFSLDELLDRVRRTLGDR
jgi:CheY-like chemotaxis protein